MGGIAKGKKWATKEKHKAFRERSVVGKDPLRESHVEVWGRRHAGKKKKKRTSGNVQTCRETDFPYMGKQETRETESRRMKEGEEQTVKGE